MPAARDLLAYYRLEGVFDREEKLLRTLLAREMITANDAERLGFILAAQGDLFGAREALMRFDEIANPERSAGRLVLFDVLVATGNRRKRWPKRPRGSPISVRPASITPWKLKHPPPVSSA